MKERKKLTLQMAIFTFIIFVSFGIIILNENIAPYFSKKIDKRLNTYLQENYSSIINTLKVGNTNYENTEYRLKVTSKENKNLYFYLKFSDKKITDTYKEDYEQGKTLLTKITKDVENTLKEKYHKDFKITILGTLDKFGPKIKEQILKEDILSIPIYNLETDITTSWDIKSIIKNIESFNSTLLNDNINAKNYNLILIDKAKENRSVKIINLNDKLIIDETKMESIINDILKGKKSKLLDDNNIKYEQIKE